MSAHRRGAGAASMRPRRVWLFQLLVLLAGILAVSSCGDDDGTKTEPLAPEQVIAAVLILDESAEVLVTSDFDPSYKVSLAPDGDERSIEWSFVDANGGVLAGGVVGDPRVAVAEFDETGAPAPVEVDAGWGVVELVVPNVEGEIVFAAPPVSASGSVQARAVMTPKPKSPAIVALPGVDLTKIERLDSHAPCRPVNILLTADGYTQGELATAKKAAFDTATGLYDYPGYTPHWQETGLFWLPVASNESGITDGAQVKDTAFATQFGAGDLRRCAKPDAKRLSREAISTLWAAKRKVDADVIALMVNTDQYTGCAPGWRPVGPWFTFSARDKDRKFVFAHELGHALVGLADEYSGGGQSCDVAKAAGKKNVSNDLSNLPWKDLVNTTTLPTTAMDTTTIGAYQGGNYCSQGVYRPQHDCMMRTLRQRTPCAACKRAIDQAYADEKARRAQPGAICLTGDMPPGEGGSGTGGGGEGGGTGGGWGQIIVGEHVGSETEHQTQLGGIFAPEAPDLCLQGCTATTIGACTLLEHDGPPGGIFSFVGAGALTFSGSALSSSATIPEPSPPGPYYAFLPPTTWQGGETVSVQTTGGDVPAFELTATAPPPLVIASPPRPGEGWVISRSADLTFGWAPIDATVTLSFSRGAAPTEPMTWGYTSISCLFDGNTGTGTLPADLLELIPAHESPFGMTGDGPGQLTLGRGAYDTVTAGSFTIATSLVGPGSWGGSLAGETFWLE